MQGLQTEVQIEGVLWTLDRAQVAHELGSCLGDICQFTECLGIAQSVVGHVWLGEASELVVLSFPIEVTAVHNHTAYLYAMSVHIFGGGMGDNVCAKLKWTAVDRGREGIVHNQWHTMLVGDVCYALNI